MQRKKDDISSLQKMERTFFLQKKKDCIASSQKTEGSLRRRRSVPHQTDVTTITLDSQ